MLSSLALMAVTLTAGVPGAESRQPQIASGDGLTAVAFGAGNGVYVATSRNNGRTFDPAVKVAEPGILSLGRHRGPRVAVTTSGIVVTAVWGEKGKGQDGDILSWYSGDGGKTWKGGQRVNGVAGSAREGLHAMAASGDRLYTVWLDLREKGTRLYGSMSQDGGRTWSANQLVYSSPDGHICECCHPSVTIAKDGSILVMWRNWLGGARDLYVARSSDGGTAWSMAEKQGAGSWPLNACPMDGGGVAIGPAGKVVSAWRRERSVFLSQETGAEIRLADGRDPAIAVNRDGVYVAWSDEFGVRARVPGKTDPVLLDNEGGYASLAAAPGGRVLAAWEAKGQIRVARVE